MSAYAKPATQKRSWVICQESMTPGVEPPELLLSAVLNTLALCIADNLAACRFSIDSPCCLEEAGSARNLPLLLEKAIVLQKQLATVGRLHRSMRPAWEADDVIRMC